MAKRVMQQVARATNNIMVVVLVVEFKTQETQIVIVFCRNQMDLISYEID